MVLTLNITRLDSDLPLPRYAYTGDAAFDLYAREETTLAPGERVAIPSGVKMQIPDGYVGLIWDKSSIGIKHGLKTLGGVVDASFRGEVLIGIVNLSDETYTFEKGDKVAQMILQKKEQVEIEEVEELGETERGEGRLGSSGK